MQARLLQRVPVGLLGDDLAAEQAQDEVERLLHAVALGVGIDVEHHGVRRQQAGPGTEHDAAARLMVELDDAVRDHQGVMVGQRDDAGAEPDVLGALGNRGDEQLRRGDGLESCRVMLTNPGLVVTEPVEPFDELEVAMQHIVRILVQGVERRQENPMFHTH